MIKRSIAWMAVIVLAGMCAAAAQSSHTSSSKSASPKPLTPKSSMPAPRKSKAVTPAAAKSKSASQELDHLERQSVASPKTPKAAKVAPLNPAATSHGPGSGINAKYQKPVADKNPSK
jgi:hypothetical protein